MEKKNPYLEGTLISLNEAQKEKAPYSVQLFDRRFIVYPQVHSPKYFSDTEFFLQELRVKKGESFLEMGCGTGIVSVWACVCGAKEVVALDINPYAVKNASENAFMQGFGKKIRCIKSNLFSALKDEKFDTIFYNMPFHACERDNISMLEKSVFDPQYKNIAHFAKDAKKFLNKGGRVLIGFSKEIGDAKRLREILVKNNYSIKIIASAPSPISKVDSLPITFQLIEAIPSK